MTTDRRPKTGEEIDAELAESASLERRLMRGQSRAERRLIKAARRSKEAERKLDRAQSRLAEAESVASQRRAALDVATVAVAAARAARETGLPPAEPSTTDG